MYHHGGELPGFNSFIGHDPDNDVTLVIRTNLTVTPDAKPAIALLPTLPTRSTPASPLRPNSQALSGLLSRSGEVRCGSPTP
jgi:D-alanyl-D-alanine carboxypeptidase